MNTPDFAKLLSDMWPLMIAAVAGALISNLFVRRPANIGSVRRKLGSSLKLFAKVPAERLNPALLEAGRSLERGWNAVVSSALVALVIITVLFSFELFRALFPGLPRWHGYLVSSTVAGLLAWGWQRLERRALLHRLEYLHDLQPVEYLRGEGRKE